MGLYTEDEINDIQNVDYVEVSSTPTPTPAQVEEAKTKATSSKKKVEEAMQQAMVNQETGEVK